MVAFLPFNLHCAKRFATRLLERGAPIYEAQLLLGHTRVTTTEIYAHLQPKRLHHTIDLLEATEKIVKIA
ncbi:MAG: tyrosine-type recombinase/integrase [Acidobacteriota bacterium]|nr:MAG: tyrosine-type recombinase/integrase [Acidobacteriota bacterium]